MTSVGIILYRKTCENELEFFVGHSGGPFHKNSDIWYFPKGGIEIFDIKEKDIIENMKNTALREFNEEVGINLENYRNILQYLGLVKQNSKKTVHAFSCDFNNIKSFDINNCYSNTVQIEYPKYSGSIIEYPEIDKYEWIRWSILELKTNVKHYPFYKKIINNI